MRWYSQHGQPAHDLAGRRALAPWYHTNATPSAADMLAALRRVLVATQYHQGPATASTLLETLQAQAATAAAAAQSAKAQKPSRYTQTRQHPMTAVDWPANFQPVPLVGAGRHEWPGPEARRRG